jgi:hypothetical protein
VSIAPTTLAWLRQTAALGRAIDGTAAQVMLHLLERVEALEQPKQDKLDRLIALDRDDDETAPVATDEELWRLFYSSHPTLPHSSAALRACYDLGRQHGAAQPPAAQPAAAQPAPPVAPAGSLVKRVAWSIAKFASEGLPGDDAKPTARAAIREVAGWMRENWTGYTAVRLLEQEADR